MTTNVVLALLVGAGVGAFCTGAQARRWRKLILGFVEDARRRLRSGPEDPWEALTNAALRSAQEERDREQLRQSEQLRSVRSVLAIAVLLLPPSERARYLEEFRAELLDIPRNTRLPHALSLLRGVFVLRLHRGPKDKAADAAVRRAKD